MLKIQLDAKVAEFITKEINKKFEEEFAKAKVLWQKNWLLEQAKDIWEKEWDKEWQEIWQ
jgi:hypothetical protein